MKRKIVIVDNNIDIKEMYEIAFKDSNFDLKFFTNSLEALQYLYTHNVDAVLIDLAMPEMDGLVFAENIRINEARGGTRSNRVNKGQPRARLAWFTGMDIDPQLKGEDVYSRVGKRHGVEIVIAKPVEPFLLIKRIEDWLSTPQPPIKRDLKFLHSQNGATFPMTVTAIIGMLVLVIVIAVYNNVLHKREEEAAYRYSDKRNELNQMTTICAANWEKTTALHKWFEQQTIKPPPEYLTQRICAVTKKENE